METTLYCIYLYNILIKSQINRNIYNLFVIGIMY